MILFLQKPITYSELGVVQRYCCFSFLFFFYLQKEAFKYWFEAATKGHPGSCLIVGEGVSSGQHVEKNCPLGVV